MAFEVAAKGGMKKGRARPDMNVTPLVDVVLVLLIIFMVITPMLAKQFWVHVPSNTPPEAVAPHESDSVVVTVDAQGGVRVNRDSVALPELQARLRSVLATRSDHTVVFDAANDAPYARAVETLDAIRGAGAGTIAVATTALAE
jgi:biopolymer transport protein TolR